MLHEIRLKKQIFWYICTVLIEMPSTSSKHFDSKFTLIIQIHKHILRKISKRFKTCIVKNKWINVTAITRAQEQNNLQYLQIYIKAKYFYTHFITKEQQML